MVFAPSFSTLYDSSWLTVAMYVISRMLLGFGIVFCIISGSAMIGELAHPKERAIMTSLFNSSYYVGAIVAAVIGLRTATISNEWSWRIPSFLQCIPSMVQIIFVLWVTSMKLCIPCWWSQFSSRESTISCQQRQRKGGLWDSSMSDFLPICVS